MRYGLTIASISLAALSACYGADATVLDADLRELLHKLDSSDATERADAACDLGDYDEAARAAVPRLVELLGDESETQPRHCGFSWNGSWASGFATPARAAAQALAEIGAPAFQPLVA
ncbi:MAG TPA: hypothetical protein VJS92_12240, partial [Candidatus Polarisedimenticolaceae bacterium]|nr:hypothetical protein [Candidatus Polarisedimenticolaceae bacterium]